MSLPRPASHPGLSTLPATPICPILTPQVILWTAILLAAILLGTIYFMLDMDSKKDPQLYAQIVDARAGKSGGNAAAAGTSR
jgi:hypothetical protein